MVACDRACGQGRAGRARLNSSFGTLGYAIIGLFALSWIVSIAIYKWRRFDDLEFGG
ncbi:MAG: hypothetical protein ABSF23_12655 [Terracidiphilus sp.]